jgi:hypothetical protein
MVTIVSDSEYSEGDANVEEEDDDSPAMVDPDNGIIMAGTEFQRAELDPGPEPNRD